jgi:hypothetical protein
VCPYCETPVETPTTIEFPPAPRRERPSQP